MGTNWKGKAGALGILLTALAYILKSVSDGTIGDNWQQALSGLFAGLSLFGIREAIGNSKSK